MENHHVYWVYPLWMVIFHSYVDLPEGICSYNHSWLVVWNMTFVFPFRWECHHPNWLIFSRGVQTTNEIQCGAPGRYMWMIMYICIYIYIYIYIYPAVRTHMKLKLVPMFPFSNCLLILCLQPGRIPLSTFSQKLNVTVLRRRAIFFRICRSVLIAKQLH